MLQSVNPKNVIRYIMNHNHNLRMYHIITTLYHPIIALIVANLTKRSNISPFIEDHDPTWNKALHYPT